MWWQNTLPTFQMGKIRFNRRLKSRDQSGFVAGLVAATCTLNYSMTYFGGWNSSDTSEIQNLLQTLRGNAYAALSEITSQQIFPPLIPFRRL